MRETIFTWQEEEVIELLKEGYKYKEIAPILNITPSTVGDYTRLIVAKMRAKTPLHAIILAIRQGYIKAEKRGV